MMRFMPNTRKESSSLALGVVIILTSTFLLMSGFFWLPRESARASTVRTYYMAVVEEPWDYAPLGYNNIKPPPDQQFGEEENVFVQNVTGNSLSARIGKVYKKALYREYTDDTFTVRKTPSPRWRHLGYLGPVLQAEVGDTIQVVFRNMADRPYSVHPHGVFYTKGSEGAPYNDEDGVNGGDAVPPDETWTYTWPVPQRAGPGPGDPSSILWMYHSHVDEPKDTNAGLVGPIIVYREDSTRPDGYGGIMPNDVDVEIVNVFQVIDENDSFYLDENITTYTGITNNTLKSKLVEDEGFIESNLMHTINGYVYGNLTAGPNDPTPVMQMRLGQRVRWYLFGMGTEVDLHTPHWHGQTGLLGGTTMHAMRTDVVELLPGSMKLLDMTPDNVGTWLYHCHVNDHIKAGMIALFKVNPAP